MLIGVSGRARSGKDTFSEFLRLELEIMHQRVTKYALAEPIKQAGKIFGWDDQHAHGHLKEVVDPVLGFSPRTFYQLFGTELGRRLNPNLWLILAKKASLDWDHMIISDIRFDNEAEFILESGGLLIHMTRKNPDQIGGISNHASELGLSPQFIKKAHIIDNNGTIQALLEEATRVSQFIVDFKPL